MGSALAIGITVGVVVIGAIIVVAVCYCGDCDFAKNKDSEPAGNTGASRANQAVARGAPDEDAYSGPTDLLV